MLPLIQVTAQYSNAVLVALLPQISDFAKKAEIPIPTPIAIEQVAKFKCSPLAHDVGGAVMLTNGLWVLYLQGHVFGLRTPRSYYSLQNPRDIPKFYGPVNLNEDEALRFVRNTMRRLGYSLKETFTDQEPEVEMPPRIGTNTVPYYRFQWRDPVFGKTAVRVELNAEAKRIEEIRLASPFFWHPPPKLSVEAPTRQTGPTVSDAASNSFISAYLPKINDFAKRLRLPTFKKRRIQSLETMGNLAGVVTFLTDYSFTLENSNVVEFRSPYSIYAFQPAAGRPPPEPFSSYLGKWNLSETQAVELVREAVRNLGYSIKDFNLDKFPDIKKNAPVGKYIVPRYQLHWITNDPATGETISMVSAEINAGKQRLEQLRLYGPPLVPRGALPHQPERPSRPEESAIDAQTLEFLDKNLPVGTNYIRTNSPVINPFE